MLEMQWWVSHYSYFQRTPRPEAKTVCLKIPVQGIKGCNCRAFWGHPGGAPGFLGGVREIVTGEGTSILSRTGYMIGGVCANENVNHLFKIMENFNMATTGLVKRRLCWWNFLLLWCKHPQWENSKPLLNKRNTVWARMPLVSFEVLLLHSWPLDPRGNMQTS